MSFFFFKQKTAYEMRISDWSSDVCSSDLKDVLAVVDTGDRDEQFLRDALGFAEFHNASLSLVILSALPSADYALTIARPYAFLQDYTEAVEAKQQRIAALAGSTNVEVRTISDQPSVIFVKTAVYARYADVI